MWASPTFKYRFVPSGRVIESIMFLNRYRKAAPDRRMPGSQVNPTSAFVPVSLRRSGFPLEGEYIARMLGNRDFWENERCRSELLVRGELEADHGIEPGIRSAGKLVDEVEADAADHLPFLAQGDLVLHGRGERSLVVFDRTAARRRPGSGRRPSGNSGWPSACSRRRGRIRTGRTRRRRNCRTCSRTGGRSWPCP